MDGSSFLPQNEQLEGEVKHLLFLEHLGDLLSHSVQFLSLKVQELLSKLDNFLVELEEGEYGVLLPACNHFPTGLVCDRLKGLVKIVVAPCWGR